MDGFASAQFVVRAGLSLPLLAGEDDIQFGVGENKLSRPVAGGSVKAGVLKSSVPASAN